MIYFSSDFDLHEYRHYYLAENWRISKRVRKTHQLSPSNFSYLLHLHTIDFSIF